MDITVSKRVLQTCRYTHHISREIDRTLEYSTPAWLDDVIVATRGSKQDHEKKLFDVLSKLEKAGHRGSKKKSEFFLNETKWLDHEINENKIKPNEDKVDAILKLKAPESTKDLKSFLGAIFYMAKLLPKFFGTDRPIEKITKKERTMETGTITRSGFKPDKTNVNRRSMLSTLCKKQRQHGNNRRK